MRWRAVPPVYSPIAPASLVEAAAAMVGLRAPSLDSLARRISSLFDAPEVLLTDSGTSALVLALEATVRPGDMVAFPAYACIDIIAAAVHARVRVVLYDLDPHTLGPDMDSVRAALQSGARALVVAPLFGYPVDMPALGELAIASSVTVIEDAAQGAAGCVGGKRIGAFGDVSVLSFGRGKGTTAGSGGALLVRKPVLLEWSREARARLGFRSRGERDVIALAAQWLLARPLLYAIPSSIPLLKLGEMVYRPAHEPAPLTAAAAAVLPSALDLMPAELQARRARAAAILADVASTRRFTPVRPLAGAEPGYLRLALLDSSGTAGSDPHVGAVRGYPVTLDEHPETKRILAHLATNVSGARFLRDRLFTLPTHSRVGAGDLKRLRAWLGAQPFAPETPSRMAT